MLVDLGMGQGYWYTINYPDYIIIHVYPVFWFPMNSDIMGLLLYVYIYI